MIIRGVAVTALLFTCSAALAQDGSGEDKPKRDLLVTIGAGAQAYARFPGDDGLGIRPMPIFSFRKVGDPIPIETPDEGIGFSLLGDEGGIEVGPAVQLQGKRREKDVGAAVGRVGFTVEAGAFVQAYLGESFRIRAEGRRGIGGHEAWTGDLSADFVTRSDTTVFTIGPRLRVSDGRYNRTYFGVTPAVATATGLAAYTPKGGIRAVGIIAGLTHQFSDTFGMYGYAGYDRLVGDAADSPIVRTYGSRSQPSVGLGLTYTFTVKRGGKD
jgi:outer membrane scaffolding protein for murein synthesis (MipA/OmpV family)